MSNIYGPSGEFIGRESDVKMLTAVQSQGGGGWLTIIRESFAGAFQQHVVVDGPRDVVSFSGVFAPLTLIAGDIAKLRVKLVEEDEDGICTELDATSPFVKVLRKPNHYQTRIQFWWQWIITLLLWGNTYVLKVRENTRRMVKQLYILDPARVKVLVAESGDVFYELSPDHLSGLIEKVVVPASEIIHDRINCLWHGLVGVSPLYACALSATQGRRIQSQSTTFFDNASRPSGMLVAPGTISTEDAAEFKRRWEENYGQGNAGRTAVLGAGLKYEAISVPAEESQLIEQLGWTKYDCADCFHVPHFKVGGDIPTGSTIEALNLMYYTDCLQALIEGAELCLDEGLEVQENYYCEFDLEGLLRMDQTAQMKMLAEGVKGGLLAPNEGRQKINRPPVSGGESVYLQQQNFSVEALAKRDAKADPFATAAPKAAPDERPAPVAITADGVTMNVPGIESLEHIVKQLDKTLKMPVVPVKDKHGVILYGQRMEHLPAELQHAGDAMAQLSDLFVKGLEART